MTTSSSSSSSPLPLPLPTTTSTTSSPETLFNNAIHHIEHDPHDISSITHMIQSIHNRYSSVNEILNQINSQLYRRWIHHIIHYTLQHRTLYSLIDRYYTYIDSDTDSDDNSVTEYRISLNNLYTFNTLIESW
jgi:hypothetical protein